uniref:WGS project CBMG000000000 data, contig CS5907-c002735 n=1 Tax=Fusarium acuminatum CS5907 TaxID=1318461 RepID=A0A090M9N3_9HYPO|nr:unnamed protein product [Fusarium acuminatum CS5907]
MFPIYTKPEVDMIITTSLASEPADQEAVSEQLVNKMVAYGELLAICALGFQYDRQWQFQLHGENDIIDMLQQKMAQITVLKANILRAVACFRVLSSAVLRQMRDDLEAWRSSLPAHMRLEALVQSPEISPD